MAKTLAEMRTNYANAASYATAAWEAARNRIVNNWVESMTKVLGHPPGAQITAKFRAKIERAQYHYGDPETFIRHYDEKMST